MIKQLIATIRPLTSVFAALLTVVGFRFFHPVPVVLTALLVLAFAGITASIMSFNDYVDRHHDKKKGKSFASENTQKLIRFWGVLSGATALILIAVSAINPRVALNGASGSLELRNYVP